MKEVWCDECACFESEGSCDSCIGSREEEMPDPLTLPWVFEAGADCDGELGALARLQFRPYRTIFAGEGEDRWPLADLADEAPDEVGLLMAQAVPMRDLLREAVRLMPLGTAKRAGWMSRAMAALKACEAEPAVRVGSRRREETRNARSRANRGGAAAAG